MLWIAFSAGLHSLRYLAPGLVIWGLGMSLVDVLANSVPAGAERLVLRLDEMHGIMISAFGLVGPRHDHGVNVDGPDK